jgi:hypothetical protein
MFYLAIASLFRDPRYPHLRQIGVTEVALRARRSRASKRARCLLRLMSDKAKILERAYELARSGKVGNVDQLVSALKREGYDQLEAYFTYSSLRRDLNKICRDAWAAAGNSPLPDPRRRKVT